jgi:hypothetical protein
VTVTVELDSVGTIIYSNTVDAPEPAEPAVHACAARAFAKNGKPRGIITHGAVTLRFARR